jgi:predicted metal-binding membrane protein
MEAIALHEQPGAAWRLLDTRSTVAVAAPLIALGLVGWYLTVRQAGDMSGMVMGLGQVGTYMPSDMAVPAFMVMWLWMMVAMMLPAIGPVVLAQRLVARARGEGWRVSVAFVTAYLSVWLIIGLIPLLAFLGFRSLPVEGRYAAWLPIVGGSVLLIAGAYQFTPWKNTCLRACRSPLAFVTRRDARPGAGAALRAGAAYGLYCLGSCSALMAVLVVVGLTNLAWMAVIALVFLAEKNWRGGVLLTRVAGAGVAALGAAVMIVPPALQVISR